MSLLMFTYIYIPAGQALPAEQVVHCAAAVALAGPYEPAKHMDTTAIANSMETKYAYVL